MIIEMVWREGCKGLFVLGETVGGNRLSLQSKRFRGIWEQRKTKERGFRCFVRAKNGARDTKECKTPKIPFLRLSLLPNPTKTLATQARRGYEIMSYAT